MRQGPMFSLAHGMAARLLARRSLPIAPVLRVPAPARHATRHFTRLRSRLPTLTVRRAQSLRRLGC